MQVRSSSFILAVALGAVAIPGAALGFFEAASFQEAVPVELSPSPAYSPMQVVELQLGALGSNAAWGDDRGIEITFGFASPGNRSATGPLPRFSRMVKGGYGALLDHEGFEIGPPQRRGSTVAFPVTVRKDGQRFGFVWVLSRQNEGPYDGCWMTDAVIGAGPAG